MKALSIKQPWANLIVDGLKPIENRKWKTNYRGRIYIHASAMPVKGTPASILTKPQLSLVQYLEGKGYDYFGYKSAIIGEVDIVDCVQNHTSIWAEKGCWHWVLENAERYTLPIKNVKGNLSFWNYTKPTLL